MKKIIWFIIILAFTFLIIFVCSKNFKTFDSNTATNENMNIERLNTNIQIENTLANNTRNRFK